MCVRYGAIIQNNQVKLVSPNLLFKSSRQKLWASPDLTLSDPLKCGDSGELYNRIENIVGKGEMLVKSLLSMGG